MRRTIIILVIVIIIIGAGAFVISRQQASQDQELEVIREAEIARDQIAATVNAAGTTEPEALVTLSFRAGGNIQSVNVIRGQQVSSGDVLATLDTGELALTVQQAQDSVDIQELTLQQALNSAPSQATLDSAQADIDAAEANLAIAQANVSSAEASVAQAQAQRAQLLAGATPGQIAAAESQVTSANTQLTIAQDTYDQVTRCANITLPTGEDREVCPGLGVPEEQARANLASAQAAVEAAEANLADVQSGPRAADLQAANAAIAAAEAQLESAQGNVQVAEANLARAQAAYDRLLEGPTADDIAILEAQVDAAETNLGLAQLRLEQAMIMAPMDGRIASLQVKEGEQATPGAPAITLIDEGAYHIEVSVDEIDIDQIAEGQPVEITLDALPDTVLDGVISEIAPTALTSGAGVVTYLVTINIDPGDIALRPGMTANATIITDLLDDVLIVPNWAIRLDRETGEALVNRETASGTFEEVPIVTGLRNEQFSEVISGLEEGDVVVVTNEREGLGAFFGG
ncbi:MAG: efflux RND transporter periplasmic adaptor subunit [Chloroflexota bacterium]|jgi:HlyD family secretion protein